ncbi:MAG: M81 family metallopeptidase [Rhodobacteraceae bacterium]|nr:M81 family metallopeptidase [Paracoccaceae bacterium]
MSETATSPTARRAGSGANPRIAVAGFQHETNCFTPIPATLADFVREDGWPGLTESDSLIRTFSGTNIPIGGFIDAMLDRAELVPVLWASAEPSNLVERDAFEVISAKILDGIAEAMPLDGIYLDLHGAMVCEDFEDGEGELLARVRNFTGQDVPIAASLDLHANVTDEMVSLADIITVFRTYPHLDMAQTGARAGDLLLEIIHRGRKPHMAFRKLPFLIPLQAQGTDTEPAQSLYGCLPAPGSLGTVAAEIALGFPPADIRMCGPAIITASYSREIAEHAADMTQERLLWSESQFPTGMDPPETAVRRALTAGRAGRPAILADVQDNSGAGATSDTTALLAELVRAGARNTALAALCDPEIVAAAHRAGTGREIRAVLGGKTGGSENPGFEGRFRVSALSDGKFDYRGSMMNGVRANLGPTAALQVVDSAADVQVVATSERTQCLDRAVFSHLGIEPADMTILALKSTVHFRADFAPLASAIIPVEAPGYNPCRLRSIPYRRLRRGVRLM